MSEEGKVSGYLPLLLSSLAAVLFIMVMANLGLYRIGTIIFFIFSGLAGIYFWFRNYRKRQ